MKKLLYVLLSIMLIGVLSACGSKSASTSVKESTVVEETTTVRSMFADDRVMPIMDVESMGLGEKVMESNVVEMKVKNYGTIVIELDSKSAPITCANFKKLVSEKFYDGLTFHRIMQGFMIQGGDPMGTGMGGSDQCIKGEFMANGVDNRISHKRGVISMARSSFPDSASSQFFICDADDEFLDGNYAAFGHVTSGMDVVDKIAADAKPVDDNGTIPPEQQPVIESMKLK